MFILKLFTIEGKTRKSIGFYCYGATWEKNGFAITKSKGWAEAFSATPLEAINDIKKAGYEFEKVYI